jgi:tryptophan synthase alpha chain
VLRAGSPLMSRIAETFAHLRASRRKALIPFLVAGDPDVAGTLRAAEGLVQSGADLLELGVPFSDPIADGPVNQRAYQRALAAGETLGAVLDLVKTIRGRFALPVVLLSYYNPILRYGPEAFCRDAARAGVDGLVIPDLPADEATDLVHPARAHGVDTVFLLAPTSTDRRIGLTAAQSTGFVYCVSLTGVTGVRETLAGGLDGLVGRIRAQTDLPICVGFGVSTPEQAQAAAALSDGVIVGSALVALLERPDGVPRLCELVRAIRGALDG